MWPELLRGAPHRSGSQGDFCPPDGTPSPPMRGLLLFGHLVGFLLLVPHPVTLWSSCATSALQPREKPVDFAHVRAKLCSRAHVAWGNGRCCQTQDFTKPQINRLPKYSILDLPLIMFKLNILFLSLQAQLPPGMPAFCDSS